MAFRTCLVTNRHAWGDDWPAALPALAGRAATAGIDLVQIREADLPGRDLGRLVAACRRAVAGSGARVLVNDRLDVALGEGADGVHLPARGLSPVAVRAVVPASFLVSRSVHAVEEVTSGAVEGCDLLVFGTVFPSASKPGVAPAGASALAAVTRASRVPVLAIGGMAEARLATVAAAGAAGVAAIGWLSLRDPAEMARRVRLVREAFDTLGQSS